MSRAACPVLLLAAALLAALLVIALSGATAAGFEACADRRARPPAAMHGSAAATGIVAARAEPEPERRPLETEPFEQRPAVLDAEWSCLLRARRDAVPWLVRAPQRVAVDRLLRSATFNPRDLVLDENGRRAVVSVIAARQADLQILAAAVQDAADREFDALHARGLTRLVRIGELQGVLAYEMVGPDPVLRQKDGKTYGITRTSMPATQRLDHQLREAGAELVVHLAQAFRTVGVLTDEELQTLTVRARSEIDRKP